MEKRNTEEYKKTSGGTLFEAISEDVTGAADALYQLFGHT
jgi:hypothetical protein